MLHHLFQRRYDARGRLEQALARLHHVQVVIGHDGKCVEHLVEQPSMLRSDRNASFKLVREFQQMAHHRRKFDCFGARAEDEQDSNQSEVYLWR